MYTLIVDCSSIGIIPSAYVIDSTGQIVDLKHLTLDNISKFAASDIRIDSIKLSGPEEYCEGIKENIEKQLAMEYANNNITVEVLKWDI